MILKILFYIFIFFIFLSLIYPIPQFHLNSTDLSPKVFETIYTITNLKTGLEETWEYISGISETNPNWFENIKNKSISYLETYIENKKEILKDWNIKINNIILYSDGENLNKIIIASNLFKTDPSKLCWLNSNWLIYTDNKDINWFFADKIKDSTPFECWTK